MINKTLKYFSLLVTLLFTVNSLFACHGSQIDNVTYVNNGNNTTTFTIDLTIDVGSSDGYSYGFALIFSNSTGTAPQVLANPPFTPTLTRPGYDPLNGYTGTDIGTGAAVTYFSTRYGNRTDVLTYESDDSWFGFGSSDYSRTIVVTVQDCVEQITLDGDYRSLGTATAAPSCTNVYNTGISCSLPCTADAGNVTVSGGISTGSNAYDLTNCQTITFTASNTDLNSGALTYGWAIFSCNPNLPLSTVQLADLTTHPCYIGTDYGFSTSDTDAGGISGTIPGGYSEIWVLPHTSDVSNSIDADGDGDSNLYEYNARLLPNDPTSFLSFTLTQDTTEGEVGLTLSPGKVGVSYALSYKDSLLDADWIPLTTVAGSDGTLGYTDENASGLRKFYIVTPARTP